MTIDEAIAQAMHLAESADKDTDYVQVKMRAIEQKQIANWLRELKVLNSKLEILGNEMEDLNSKLIELGVETAKLAYG